jgi:glycosyltransferase involved in cell wall biosynthesis
MTYLVSILIPTLIERKSVFNELIDSIHKQIKQGKYEKKVEIVSICDDRSIPLSMKRNMMQKMCSGKYFMHLDDDDELDEYFCEAVVNHIQDLPIFQTNEPDVIGFNQLAKVRGGRFIVKPNINRDFNLTPIPRSKSNQTPYQEFERFPWQYSLWNEKYKRIYRTDVDTNAREDQNWLKKLKLEYPKHMTYIDRVLHVYNFDDPSKTTTQ